MSGNRSDEAHTPGRTATSAGGTKSRSWTGVRGQRTRRKAAVLLRGRETGVLSGPVLGADAPQDTRDMPGGGAAAGTIAQDSPGLRGEARTGTGWAQPVGWGAGGRGEGGPQLCPHPTGLRCYLLGS